MKASRILRRSALPALACLAGLALILILGARERARLGQCLNNLKLIGLGLRNYAEVAGRFPPGTVSNATAPPEKRMSWFAIMVVEHWFEGGGRVELDLSRAWDAPENRIAIQRAKFAEDEPQRNVIEENPLALCPSEGRRIGAGGQGPLGYVGIGGLGIDAPRLPASDPRAGLFGFDRATRPADLKDGAATTMAVAETARDLGPWKAGGPTSVRGLDPARRPYLGRGGQFGGNHRGGTAVLFADGSVRVLADDLDPKVFEAMATIAGGEPVGPLPAE